MKTVFVMSLAALILASSTLPLVFAPSTPPGQDDPLPNPGDIKKQIAKTSEFADHLAKLDAHLMKLTAIDPSPTTDHGITVDVRHLDVIAHQLDKIEIQLNQIQANMPPGPPTNPTLTSNLQSIAVSANDITSIASQWQQIPNGPEVFAALQSIINNAIAISATANNMLQ